MKRGLALLLSLALPSMAQTINPNQIRPSSSVGQVLTTENVSGSNTAVWANATGGQGGLISQIQYPSQCTQSGGTHNCALIFPNSATTTGVQTCTGGQASATSTVAASSPFSGTIQRFNSGTVAGCPQHATITWNGATLYSYILPADVLAVYGGFQLSQNCALNTSSNCGLFSATVNATNVEPATNTFSSNTFTTTLCASSCGSFNFSSLQWIGDNNSTLNWIGTGPFGGLASYLSFVIVDYTGSAPPAGTQVQVASPLGYANSILFLSQCFDCLQDTGTSTAYFVTIPWINTVSPGTTVKVQPAHANSTTTPTLSINGETPVPIEGPTGAALQVNDIGGTGTLAEAIFMLDPDGKFRLQNPQVSSGGGTTTNALTANSTGGASPGSTFNGSAAVTVDYHSFGAAGISGTPTTGHCTDWASANTLGDAGAACGSGGAIDVNGSPVSSPNFNGSTPAAPGGNTNVTWQVSGSNVSAYVPTAGGGGSVIPSNAIIICTGDSDCDDDQHDLSPPIAITSWSTSTGVTTVTGAGTFLTSLAVNAGGSSWAVGDQFTVSGGTNGVGVVTSVSGGAVTGVSISATPSLGFSTGYSNASAVATTAVSPSSGTGLTVNTTVGNGLAAGQWVSMRFGTNWLTFVPGTVSLGTGYTLFQVSATGLTATQFEINTSAISPGNCASSCGSAYNAMGYLPMVLATRAPMPSAAINNVVEMLSNDVTIRGTNSGFSSIFAPYCGTGTPVYLVIDDWNNDPFLTSGPRTAAQIEQDYLGIFRQAHRCGNMTVVAPTAKATNSGQQFSANAWARWYPVLRWLPGQGKTQASPGQYAAGQYWDLNPDVGGAFNDAYSPTLINQTNFGLAPGGVILMANKIADSMAVGSDVPAPQQQFWFGDLPSTDGTAGNGYVLTPSADSFSVFQILNSAMTNRAFSVNTAQNPNVVNIGGLFSVAGNTNGTSSPVGGFSNTSGQPNLSNPSVLLNPTGTSPNGNQQLNLNSIELQSDNFGAFLFSDFESTTGSSTLNSFGLTVSPTSIDTFRAIPGGAACFFVPGANTNTFKGCPSGTYALSVGGDGSTTPPFQVTSAGDTTVHTVKVTVFTVSTLPSCTSNAGLEAAVSDATAPTYLGTLTGGGSVFTPVACNGTAWVSY